MFYRKYKIKARKIDNKTVFVPMYQNWYSFTWNSLFESNDDYCASLEEATEIGLKFIVRDSIYSATGEDVDVNKIESHKDYAFVREMANEMIKENNSNKI